MKRLIFATLLGVLFQPTAHADVCGSPGEKSNVKTVVVGLRSKPAEPAFYYRVGLDYTVFVSQAQMQAFMDSLDPATASLPLFKAIRADMPLREDHDLFYYNFSDWWRLNVIKSVLSDLLRHGNAAVVAVGGHSVDKITIADERSPAITRTLFYDGKKGENEFLSIRGCIAN